MGKFSIETKVGLFAAVAILLIAYSTMKVGDQSVVTGRGYELFVDIGNATGVKTKTPVRLAGVEVGVVKNIELIESRTARLTLLVNDEVKLAKDSNVLIKAKGFMGSLFVELVPGGMGKPYLKDGDIIGYGGLGGDVNLLVTEFSDIAKDIKSVSSSLKELVGNDESSPVYRTINNLDQFAETIKTLMIRNEENFNKISENLARLTEKLAGIVDEGKEDIEDSMERIASITKKIDEGKGTVGKLVNDEETVEKLNQTLDSLNSALGGFKRLETSIGYHTEYLTQSEEFKHYVGLDLKPSPDKAFMLEFVNDPSPDSSRVQRTTDVTVGNNTTTITTDSATIARDRFTFSAQIAKKFYDFTVRGGVIESSGGVGLDYGKGPFGVEFSAFDFETSYGEKPHLKLLGNINVTENFYLVGGADDMISPNQKTDWFVGAGIRLVDEDVKGLFSTGLGSLVGATK